MQLLAIPGNISAARYFLFKSLLIMKFAIVLLMITLQVSARSYGQDISVSAQDMSLKEVFVKIQKESGYLFWYEDKLLHGAEKVNVNVKNATLRQALDACFKGQPLTYAIVGKTIVVQPRRTIALPEQSQPPSVIVTGTVTDNGGAPLTGVTVRVKGQPVGTVTDEKGAFTLEVADENSELEFSYVGYETQAVSLNGRSSVAVVMVASLSSLDQLVVVGYGMQKKSDLTGSIGIINSETLSKRPVNNVEEALSGRIPGVDVSVNSGEPGGNPKIWIRGVTSVSNTSNPLYVVDGVMLNMESLQAGLSSINTIDPSSIESIEVLKDASATAIYGARGANGVILITTKKGSNGGRVSYNSYISFGRVARRLDLTNAREFMQVEDIAYLNAQKFDSAGFAAGKYIDPKVTRTNFMVGNTLGNPELFDGNLNPLYNTDWQDVAVQDAITNNQSLSFTGGNDKTKFGVYLNYRNENGIMRSTWMKRYSGRLVIDSKVKSWLSVGASINYNNQTQRALTDWAIRAAFMNTPIMPVRFPDGSWSRIQAYPGIVGTNQRQAAEESIHIRNTQNTLANVHSIIDFGKGLKLKTMVASNIVAQEADAYSGRTVDLVSLSQKGIATVSSLRYQNWQFENLLMYSKSSHSSFIDAVLGQTIYQSSRFSSAASAYGFLDDYFQYNNLGVGDNPRPPSSSASKYSMSSFFGRLNYTYHNKYLLTITGRYDGSSKFGKNNRFGFFPSAALGWLLSEENFLKNSSAISYFKLRASYGVTGNSEIPNYQYEAGLGDYTTIFNGARATGIGISTLANSNLKWEVNKQLDIGVELNLFKDRISIEADVYNRVTNNMLLNKPVPMSSGYRTVTDNIGSMRNRGVEFSATTNNIHNHEFSWSTTINWSANQNEVTKLSDGSDIYFGKGPGATPGSVVRVGLPVNEFLGFIRVGTWGTDEAKEAAGYNRRPGDVKYKDANDDGVINSEDWVPIGNGFPKGYGSLINTFTYKHFELSADIQFMYGNDVAWGIMAVMGDRTGAYNNMLKDVLYKAWTPERQNTPIPQNKPLAVGYDTNNDSYRVKDGSFIRGKNIMLAYNFSNNIVSRLKLNSLRVYASAQNLFIITGFPGYDPEVSTLTEQQFSRGEDSYSDYPKARVFTLGINVEL